MRKILPFLLFLATPAYAHTWGESRPIIPHPVLSEPVPDPGIKVLPEILMQTHTFCALDVACTWTGAQTIGNNINFTGSTSTRTFSTPVSGTFNATTPYRLIDNSSDSTDAASQGNSHYLPYHSISLVQNGSGLPIPIYTSVWSTSSLASNTPGGNGELTGGLTNANLSTGARNSGVWGQVIVTGSSASTTITNATCAAGTVTLTTSTAHGLLIGDPILVSLVVSSTGSYNGRYTAISPTSGTTVTYSETCPGTYTSGGRVSINSSFYGFEANHFVNAFDPLYPTAPDGLNGGPVWGIASTNLGTFPVQAAFLSNYNSSTSVAPYIGYLSQGAQSAHFQSGWPCNSCGVADPATYGFLSKYGILSSAGTPLVNSFKDGSCDSAYSAGSQEHCFLRQMVPSSTTVHVFNELYDTTVIGGWTNSGDHFSTGRYCADSVANTCATGSVAGDGSFNRNSASAGFVFVGSDGTGYYGRNGANMVVGVPSGGALQASAFNPTGFFFYTETTAPTPGAGSDYCYGDSTLHSINCSLNNGPFMQLPYNITLTSQYTNSTTTFSNVAGGNTIQFPVLASRNYTATCHLYYQSAATGGLNIEFTGPASPTAVIYGLNDPSAATTFNGSVATAYSTSLGQVVGTATTNFDAIVSFSLINGANAGTVNLLAKSSAAVQLQIQAGSFCRVQ